MYLLDYPSFLECRVSTILVDSLDSLSRKSKREVLFELRYINTLVLQVWILASFTCRVEFASTNYVRVAPADN